MDVNERLKQLKIEIPEAPPLGGIYSPLKLFGSNLAYISGCSPHINGVKLVGRLGDDYTLEQGQDAARKCALNILAVIKQNVGDLNRIKSFAKILAFVRCTDEFIDQPKVVNGASQLLLDVFGEDAGKPARSAIGTNALPGGMPVEIEALIELKA